MDIIIPTNAYLRKYLMHTINNFKGIIEVNQSTAEGIILLKMFQKKNYDSARDRAKSNGYDSTIKVIFSDFYLKSAGLFLSSENIALFNKTIKKNFEAALFDYLLICKLKDINCNYEEEILRFLSLYHITEEELKLDAIKKAFYRWRDERNWQLIKG